MAFEKRTPRHDWRSWLTEDEQAEVDEYDRISAAKQEASIRIGFIRNRAIQRSRYAEKKG